MYIAGYMYRISAGLTGQQMEHRQEQSITNTQSKLFREVIPDDADNVPEMGKAYKEKSDNVRYSVSVSDAGWQEYSANGEIAGTTGKKTKQLKR